MTRKLTGAAFVSLDGVMQAPGGPTEDPTGGFDESGWVFRMDDDGINDTLGALFGAPYDLLLGRRTYDIFAAYWPYVEGENAFMGESLTQAGKYVLTSSDASLEWESSHRLSAIDEVPALKQSDGPDLLIQGSSTLYPQLLDAGLLDRLVLMTFPIVLGRGKRLLDGAMSAGKLKLVDHRVTGKGTVITTYEPDGTIPPMPANAPEPATSKREMARRARIEAGTW